MSDLDYFSVKRDGSKWSRYQQVDDRHAIAYQIAPHLDPDERYIINVRIVHLKKWWEFWK